MRLCKYFFFLLLSASPFLGQSQKYARTETSELWDDYLHDQHYIPATGQYLLFNYASPHGTFNYNRKANVTSISAFDKKLKQLYSKEVTELADKTYETSFILADKVAIIYSDKDRNVFACLLNPADGTTSSTQKLFSFQGERYEIHKATSTDSTLYVVVSKNRELKATNEDYVGVVLDKQMSVKYKFSTAVNEERKNIASTTYQLMNNGTFCIISGVKVKYDKTEFRPMEYQVKMVSASGSVTSVLSGLPDGLLDNIAWRSEGSNLEFIGLLATSKKGNFVNLVSGKFNVVERKIIGIKEVIMAQAPSVVNNPQAVAKLVAKEGIPIEVELIKSFNNDDKTIYMILEKSNSKTNNYLAANMGFGSVSNVSSTTNTADDVYIIKISPDKEIEWLKVVQKRQIEHERKIYLSTVAVKDHRNGLHLLFNDHIDNGEADPLKTPTAVHLEYLKKVGLCDVYIDRAGKTTKSLIQDYEGIEQGFSPEQSMLTGNKVVYTAYQHKNGGKSKFRLGVIEVQ